MANELVSTKSVIKNKLKYFEVSQVKDPTVYAAVLANTYKLPDYSFVALVASGGGITMKFARQGSTWANALPVSAPAV